MFVYLIKKIAIPNGVKLQSLAWNPDQGWIACGGEQGLLKVLKLESLSGGKDAKNKGVAAASNLSMNQTLEGHQGAVMCVTWNAPYRKLTTSDQNGLIIVWMLHKGVWLEEMINNRNKSVVRAMKWTGDGQKICIVYEDGAVIVGSVDGNRLWGKELDVSLRLVDWSPDARHILFVTKESDVLLYDSMGNKIRNVHLFITDTMAAEEREECSIVGLHWYDGAEGSVDPLAPTLAVAYDIGKVQLSRSLDDDRPIVLDTQLKISQCKWNTSGSILSVAGTPRQVAEGSREVSSINFYDAYGKFIRTLKVPGSGITALSWEGSGLRIALAVDAFIYFANIRADYKWCYINKTLVYAYNKADRPDTSVVFWDISSDSRYTKYRKNVKALRAAGDHVAIVLANPGEGSSTVHLCNVIGVPLETRDVPLDPLHVAMTPTHVLLSDGRSVYTWQYRTQPPPTSGASGAKGVAAGVAGALQEAGAGMRKGGGRERMLDINDPSPTPAQSVESYKLRGEGVDDPITAIGASDKTLAVGRRSGYIHLYGLPSISVEGGKQVNAAPQLLALNSNSSRLAVVDVNGVFSPIEVNNPPRPRGAGEGKGDGDEDDEEEDEEDEELAPFERKDVWDVKWAEDDPNSIAVMEKTRLYVYVFPESHPTDASAGTPAPAGLPMHPAPEGEPVQSSGYLAVFKSLQVRTMLLDEVLANPDGPDKDAAALDFETRALRDLRDVITHKGLDEAFRAVDAFPHPRLWTVLAELSLEALDLTTAEKAFVRAGDYQGIQYVKRLHVLGDRMKQRAEVAVYFDRIDEAEAIYREIDRKDLAIHLRERMGDWSRVVQLVQNGGGDDQVLAQAWNKIGDYYADKFKWAKAAQYYSQAKSFEKVATCYFRMEDYDALDKLIQVVPYGNRDFLLELGHMLQTVGMVESAAECFIKAGDPKQAIDCCVLLNHWSKAVELAEQHNFPQIEGLLTKQVNAYMESGDKLKAIELFRKANRAPDAAQLLACMAEDLSRRHANPLRAKKLQVLAALEVERFRKKVLDATLNTAGRDIAMTTAQTLDNLMTVDRESGKSRVLDNAWRGAAAYHYQALAHRQLYGGAIDAAMKTAIRLAEFEDILGPRDVYSLIALAALQNRHFGVCSRAFIKLETLPTDAPDSSSSSNNSPSTSTGEDWHAAIQNLAVEIFTKNAPYDPAPLGPEYIRCLETGSPYHACTVTGRSVADARTYMCRTCRHFAIETELRNFKHCPLCHSVLH